MKPSKRIISLLLVLALLFTMLPVPTQAAGSKPQTSVDTGDLTIEGTNGFGNLLSQEIQESQDDSATAEEGYEAGYSIIDLTFDGSTATVEYSSLEEARLVVAVYSEDGLQMLASGETTINPEEDVATVTIEGDMPEYFLASAYLMDTHDLSPLCAAYDTPMYTQEMQELLESTVDDYDPDRVLNLDEDKTTNFAVYAEDTILVEPVDGFNIVTTVDDENGIYVIENADEQITSLQVGDVFSYAYGENEILIVKVAAITVDGTTVTITSSDELEMDEVFSHVKIENAGDTDDLVIDESTVDEGLVYEGVETENGSIQPQAYDGSISHNTSLKYKIAYGDSKRGIEVSGSAKFSITLSLELYISWSYSRVEITLEPVVTFGAEIKSELASDGISLKMGQISLPFMYGAAKIKFTPKFVAEFSGSVGVEAKVSAKFGFYFETGKRGPKFQLIRISTCDGFELDAEVGLFAGLELTPEVEVLGGSVMEAKITGKIGVEATCSPNDRDTDENADVRHICVGCVDGDLSAVLSINASLKVLGKNALKKLASTDLSFVDWKAKFADFYLCFEHKDFGWGGCPRSEYRTTVYVKDSDENPLYNADVYVGDQKKKTDKNGIAVFYLKYGTHDISADYEELYAQKTVGINKAQKVSLIARPDDYPSGYSENIFGSIIPDDIVDDTVVYISGQCGDDLFWNLLSDGRLFIGGTGPMWNYDYGEAPWYSERSSITEVWLGRGFVDEVTSIGDYAFADCTNLSWVVNADFVTYIGDFAFYGCKSLTNEGMSDCVTTIGSNAFAYCTSLTSVELPDSLTTIGNRAFEHCRKLISVNIPDSVITIGDSAFYYCDNLTSVTIGKSVTTIGNCAFTYCRKLKSVEIPDSVTTIGFNTFYCCTSLCSVDIPDSVTSIGAAAFYRCTNLCSVDIPDSVTSIGDGTFMHCTNLTHVTIPDSVTTIGAWCFEECTNLSKIVFRGNAPTIGEVAFGWVTATAYYPAGNTTWTSDVRKDYDGTITWVPYTLDGNGNMVANSAAAFTVDAEVAEIGLPDIPGEAAMIQNNLQISEPDFGNREEPLNPNAVYDGEYSTIVTETYTLKTASFSGLVPGEQYVLLAMVSIDVENPLAADNLLYIDQAAALEDGTLVFQYVQRTPTETSYVVACGASNKDLNDAEISFPEMIADGETLIVNPTVVYDGKTLTEGQDYTIQGTVSVTEPGTYTCYIRGIRNYSGLVECTYAVITPYNEVAYGFCGDNMTWTFYDNGRLTISGMGEMTEFDSNSSVPWNDRRSSILAVIVEDGVTTISDFAFAECANLTSVKIGNSVTTIGDLAFSECPSLTSVKIPDSVSTIGSYVFQDCSSLTKVTIGNSLTNISAGAFQYCSSLASVTIGESVTTIGYGAFQSCTSLSNITLPNSVINIGNAAFKSCTGLTSVTIGEAVTDIGSSAFSGCTSLISVEIPQSVTTIGDSAFGFCSNLIGIYVDEGNQDYSSDECGVLFDKKKNELIQAPGAISGSYKIPDGVSTISNDAFNFCTRLSSVEIPSSVATIEYSAFESCTGMTSVVIPYGVIRIGDEAFKSCTGLTSVSIPDSVTHIGNEAFSSCTNLTSVLIGESVGAIGNYAFRACTSLIEIDVDERNPNYSSDDWGVLYDKEKVELIQAPAALSGSYEIPDSVTTIESYAFRSCASLTSLTIPQSVDTIGNYAFSSCIGLSQITFMGDAPTINAGAFSSVTATAYYPATNPTWSEDIFQSYGGTITWTTGTPGCVDHRYNMVVKEPTCTEQGYTTYTCPTCGDFYTTDETQPLGHNYESIANGSGKLTYTCSICGYSYTNDIQDDIVYGFYDDGVWINGYTGSARRLLLPGAIDARVVTRIGDKAFFECSTLVSVTIQGMVTHIGNSAFEGCTSLSGITIPYYTSSIGDYAFRDCSSLSTIYFEGNAPAFGEDVFNGVIATAFYPAGNDTWTDEVMQDFGGVITWLPDTERLDYSVFENYVEIYGYEGKATELIIPAEIEGLPVTTIGWSAFANCDNLASVTIPASVTAIGNSAFAWCDSLATIYFEGDAPTFGEDVFSNVYATAYFPDTTTWTDEVLRDYGGGIEWKTLDDLYLDPGLEYEVYGDHVEIIEYYNRVTTEFVIPAKINRLPVTVIRTEAFKYCDSLISISIPEGVTYIGDKAFYNLDTLNSVSIHGNISYIGDSAFERCSNLTTINIPDSVTHIGKYAFMYCENLTGNINITEKITYIGDYAFYCCYNLTGSVTIPAGSIFIGRGIFSECDSLTSVTFQDGVTSIVDELFCGCNSMTNITIPDTVTIIGDSAFEDCDGLTSIDIPASITHVGAEAFEFCSRLKTIRFLGDAPEFGENVFLSVYGKAYYPGSNPTWTTEVMENCEDYSISWVAEGEVFGMEIVSTPKSGFVGQEPDLSDLCVELIYGNNIRRRTDNWYLTISEIDTTVAGKKNVTISYGDFSEEFTFFVHETEPGIVLDPSLYPESEHNYGNNLVENRSLTWPGTIGLVLLFSEKTYVEDGCDWITVLDGKGNRLAIYSGSEAAGVTLVVPGDTVQILLNSDYSSSGYGYSFDSITTLNTHHTGSTIAPVVEPTCTEPGHTEGFICEVCDQPQYTAIPALGHDFGEWETVTEASCTEKGVEQQQCSRCDHAEIRFYKALGHVWDAGIVTIEPTEDTAGERLYTCTVCGATKTEPIPVSEHEHSYELVVTAPTCTEQGYTTYTCRCGDSYTSDYVNALNHDMGEWRIDTEATCTEDGVKQRKCFRCDYNESRVIEATGHSWDKGVVTREPTEEIEGERLYTCTACGATMTESIPVIGHEHSYMAVVTAPTCTARGYTTYTCRCGESYTSDYVDALDHAWGDWIVIQEPTSTEDGMEEHICSRCGHTEQRSITKLENPFVDVAPGSFFYEPVMWAIENGITNGTSATTFGPNDQCMRAHVVTFLWRAMGSPEPKLTDNPFVDVKPTDFYYKPVLWALENGVTSGMDSTHFGPTLYCNRAQVVTFLYRTMGSPEVESTKNPFTDVASGSFYEKPVLWAVTNGVTSGMSATSFGPNSICNRAQIVTFLYRAFAND